MVEKGEHRFAAELIHAHPWGSRAPEGAGKRQKHPQRIAVGADGVRADVTTGHQVGTKKLLDQMR
jgi:hypothetical protein